MEYCNIIMQFRRRGSIIGQSRMDTCATGGAQQNRVSYGLPFCIHIHCIWLPIQFNLTINPTCHCRNPQPTNQQQGLHHAFQETHFRIQQDGMVGL